MYIWGGLRNISSATATFITNYFNVFYLKTGDSYV